MSDTEVPYRAAGKAAYEAWTGEPAFWNLLDSKEQERWVNVAKRTVKTFHKVRAGGNGRDHGSRPT